MNKTRRKEIEKVQDDIRGLIDELGDLKISCDDSHISGVLNNIIKDLDSAHSYLDDAHN